MNDNSIHTKKEILVNIVKAFFSDDFPENTRLIPYDMRPKGAEVPFRCCIYKERAILKDRVLAGLGFSIEDDDERHPLDTYANKSLEREKPESEPLTVIAAACRGCVPNRVHVTDLCQGCVARACKNACRFGAINIVNGRAIIDYDKCRMCKMCVASCPYHAIVQTVVPCEESCPVGAIIKDKDGIASIDFQKCIACGKCVAACPFGAVHEKSQIIDILKHIKNHQKVIALIAPSIAGQFPGSIYQLKSAMLKAGFFDVYEVAKGADVTIRHEAQEFDKRMENGEAFMTTSCCAGYNELIKKHLPEIKPFVSNTKTPLYYTAELVREKEPTAILVFISPCLAKRKEVFANERINYTMNYEELGALLVGRKIEILDCEESSFYQESSRQGRNFGLSGGVAKAVQTLASANVQACCINGLNKESICTLKKMARDGKCLDGNLVEVMCCEHGCIGGNAKINQPKIAAKLIGDFTKNSKDLTKDE